MLNRNDRYKFWKRVNTLVVDGGKWAMAKQVLCLRWISCCGQKYWQEGQRRRESERQVAVLAKIKGQDLVEHQQILVRRLPKGGDEHFLGRKLAAPRLILIKRGKTT